MVTLARTRSEFRVSGLPQWQPHCSGISAWQAFPAGLHSLLILLLIAGLCAIWQPSRAGDPLTITAVEPWGALYGGQEAVFHFTISSLEPQRIRVGWVASVGGRVINRAETPVEVRPDREAKVEVKFTVPEVKTGVILPALLAVTAVSVDDPTRKATLEKPLWIFHHQPFADRTEWLKALKVRLFDPQEKTAPVLEKAGIPFTLVGNVEALAEPGDEMIIIAEGISFEDYRALSEIMVRAAAGGHPVLCLAPAGGVMPLPGTKEAELPPPGKMSLRRNDIITELDKRLDADVWPQGNAVASSLVLTCDRNLVVGEVVRDSIGWPWLDIAYPQTTRHLVVCGFGIIAQWEAGPTPSFLLLRLLEYTAGVAPVAK